jgi:uncharacterized membrane protein YkvA (DUF1232 family)
MNRKWKAWAGSLKNNTYALYLASKDPRVPWPAKVMIVLVVAYALSPIDLIPDFLPILGYLDDLLLLPIGIYIAVRMIPATVWQECQLLARQEVIELPKNWRAGLVIIAIWVWLAIALLFWFWPVAEV